MKLQVGSIIKVHGFPFLKGLESGKKYVVREIRVVNGGTYYIFTLKRGSRLVGHSVWDVDSGIKCVERGDNNGFSVEEAK